MFYVGIDVSKDKLDVCVLGEDRALSASFANQKSGWHGLVNWLKKRHAAQPVWICLEATGRYSDAVTAFLYQHGYEVSVVNPARIKGYATSRLSRNKTDQVDAALIADFCRAQSADLALWTPPDPAQHELQALVRQLEDLTTMRQQERNRLQSGITTVTVLDRIRAHIAFLDAQIKALKDEINDHIDRHPDLKHQRDLLTSIKGIANLTAAKLLAEIPHIAAFDSPQQLVAFAGLNPRQHCSGSSLHGKSRISKVGSSALRAALYMPAVSAKNTNPLLQPFVQRLQQRGLSNMSIVVAVMRKLLHLVFGILKSNQPFDPLFLEKKAALS
ncbi:MAG: IS110 family transposase [Anaerolineae bacterium]|nr:IS110 family transposase [Anaerolineae bacterium]